MINDEIFHHSSLGIHHLSTRPSIAIVGAGVFGLTAALELRARGWSVTVIDASPSVPATTAASTDISKVVRSDYGADRLYTDLADAALVGWDRWNARWGRVYHEDGFLVLASGPMRPAGFEYESFTLLAERGHDVERLDATTRANRFPAWSPERYPDGYLNRRAGWVESGNVVALLADASRAAGVALRVDTRFATLIAQGSRVTGIRTASGDDVKTDVVLVAAGAWTPALLPELSDVMWTTGQPVVHFAVSQPLQWQAPTFPVWAADIARTGWYGFPARDDGILKIGHHASGRRVHPDEPRVVLPEELARFRQFLSENLPALADAPIASSRLCLYCDTFDGDFWIDHDPDRPGLVVAAGDSGHGFKFAPILGSIIADAIERKTNTTSARFAWRPRERDSKEAARA
jgi:sarcosine oxidase / L-pipecolate oxidase